ncbi:MAG: hypothetical protein ACLFVK_03830 [Dehalococcoidia bacterium]
MSEELGRITKPEAEKYHGKRKVYVVPLLFAGQDAPAEYLSKLSSYWMQASQQISRLEATAGMVKRIYHEAIPESGEEGLKRIEQLNPSSYQIANEKCDQDAVLEAVDDKELADELMDWERFMLSGFISQKVANTVSQFYTEASKKRYEHMAKRVDETLQEGEAGLLFIRAGHSLQFPQDIEVFSVSPPALDEIHRWLRDRAAEQQEEQQSGVEPEEGGE